MRMARQAFVALGGLAVALAAATGCGPNPTQMQLEQLQKRNQELEQENTELRAKVARLTAERDQALAQLRQARQMIQDLQNQLNQAPVETGPKGWETSGPYAWVSVGTDFLFDSGKATLKTEARAKLQEIVSTIQTRPEFADKFVWVLGHTDTDPIRQTKNLWQDNLDLSCNRAMTVYRELMAMGIRPERMIAGGQGEYFKRVGNDTKAGKAQNRRVEIIVVPPRAAVGTPAGETPVEPVTSERVRPMTPAAEPTTTPPAADGSLVPMTN